MFPTLFATETAKDYDLIIDICENDGQKYAKKMQIISMQIFQSVSVQYDFDRALQVYITSLKSIGKTLTEEQEQGLRLIHEVTKAEVDGLIIKKVMDVVDEGEKDSDKLAAAKIANAINKGESIDVESDKATLIINMPK